MANSTDLIRNVALVGHGGTGKTTLLEHLLFQGGAIPKPETIESGKTVSDYGDDEIARKISIHASLSHVSHKDIKINFLDTPGSSDFVGDVILAFRACESVIVMIDARTGVQIETIKLWRNLDGRKKPRIVFASKLDEERASFQGALDDVKEKFKVTPVAITIPMGEGADFRGVVDVLNGVAYAVPASHDQKEAGGPVPADMAALVAEYRAKLFEAAAEGDDGLMEKYLGEGTLSQEETLLGLREAFADGRIIPAFAGAGARNAGISALLDFLATDAPSPMALTPEPVKDSEGNDVSITVDPAGPAAAFVIKTQIDQFSGRLSFVKVITGKLAPDLEVVNVRDGRKEKLGKLYTLQGKKLEEVRELVAGDIGIIAKSVDLKTNDTISAYDRPFAFHKLRLPTPVTISRSRRSTRRKRTSSTRTSSRPPRRISPSRSISMARRRRLSSPAWASSRST